MGGSLRRPLPADQHSVGPTGEVCSRADKPAAVAAARSDGGENHTAMPYLVALAATLSAEPPVSLLVFRFIGFVRSATKPAGARRQPRHAFVGVACFWAQPSWFRAG
jgi:hypothetical protein